jgi:hypothetical protein
MEEIVDYDQFLLNIPSIELEYSALYNPTTGEVISVGPMQAFSDTNNKISIDKETAELIIEGKIKINSCVVDLRENKLEIIETKSIFKMDDVLHRVIEKRWANIARPDIFITYNRNKQILKFQLTEEFYGTKKLSKSFQPVMKRAVKWDGDTEIHFLITDYNDPNVLYKMVSFKISDLIGNSKIYKNFELPLNFSIYTRRVFKNYVLEIL